MSEIARGIYPTMIVPYKNGEIDYDNVKQLVEWYIKNGCTGIFTVCQSTEMTKLSLKERTKLAEFVVKCVDKRINVVASGHCADGLCAQVEEMNELSKTGIDAFVLVSNRFDLHNDGDDLWIENAERFLDKATQDIDLGIYECPNPYKRLLTERLIAWCGNNKRFRFIKDTCCDPAAIRRRGELLKDSECMLFNANEQTLLYSLRCGYAGYSGIMANFHPDILAWLYDHYMTDNAEELSDILSMMAFTESPAYPCTAKYYLNLEGFDMATDSRTSDKKLLTEYQKYVVKQMYNLNQSLRERFLKNA